MWRWRDMEAEGQGGSAEGARLPPLWMEGVWMQRVCLHAVCLAEPDADSEAWDAVSAVSSTRNASDTFVLRATRDLEAGAEVLLDYGPRTNAELLVTHGFALPDNPHESVPISLAPRDEQAPLKARILAAGNITSPFALSPRALHSDSDLLVALRVIAATPTELQRYADAFSGQPLSVRNERKWRLLLRETVEALLAEVEQETTAEQDRVLLNARGFKPSRMVNGTVSRGVGRVSRTAQRRWQAAIVCRLGEKLLLRAVLADLNAALSTKGSSA